MGERGRGKRLGEELDRWKVQENLHITDTQGTEGICPL